MKKKNNFVRKSKRSKKRLPDVYITIEGQTEKLYIKKIKEMIGNRRKFNYKEGNEKTFLNETEVKDKYIILDIDGINKKNDTNNRFENIKQIKLNFNECIFFNNYCFEVFLIAHKEVPNKKLDKKGIIKEIERIYGIAEYDKSEKQLDKIFNNLTLGDVERACENIQKIENENCFFNPSSNMHMFIDLIKNL